jgi:hypothetical protein
MYDRVEDPPDSAIIANVLRNGTRYGAARTKLERDFPNVAPKILLAKLDLLIRRGLLHGCVCGCGGDFRAPNRDPHAMEGRSLEQVPAR